MKSTSTKAGERTRKSEQGIYCGEHRVTCCSECGVCPADPQKHHSYCSQFKRMKAQSWLWPDRVIGKRESRTLRDEHNSLVNSRAGLLETIKKIQHNAQVMNQAEPNRVWTAVEDQCRAAIAKTEGPK